jgi:hypothetical protein
MKMKVIKELLYDAIDAAKPMFDEKYDKCVEDGMDENETCQQSNDDITRFFFRTRLMTVSWLTSSSINDCIL